MDAQTLSEREVVNVYVNGKDWNIRMFPSLDVILKFRDWIRQQEGEPYAELAKLLPLLPPEERGSAYQEARELERQLRSFTIKSPLAQRYLESDTGKMMYATLLIRQTYPEATDEEILALIKAIGEKVLGQTQAVAA